MGACGVRGIFAHNHGCVFPAKFAIRNWAVIFASAGLNWLGCAHHHKGIMHGRIAKGAIVHIARLAAKIGGLTG